MRRLLFFLSIIGTIALSFTGCATVLSGYENTVIVHELPADAVVTDQNGITIPVHTTEGSVRKWKTFYVYKDSTFVIDRSIRLRSNTDHIISLKSGETERRYHLYPKLSAGWLFLDVITLTFLVDWYTGNWNHFDDITYGVD